MSHVVPLLVALSLSAACSSNESDSPSGGDGTATGGRPSGALVRVFNAYAPLDGEPGPVDIYPKPWVLDGAKPLRTQPYGELSEPFDPTVADDAGDMFLSFYWANTTGNGNELMSNTETLKGGEVLTYFLTTGSEQQSGGRRSGALHTYVHTPKPGFGIDVPPGKGLLSVDSIGLEAVLSNAADMHLFFSLGSGCAKGIGDSESTTQGVGPGSAGAYALDPGEHSGTVYDDAKCLKNPVANATFTISEGGRSVFFVYAVKDGDIRNVVVPLEPKTP